MKAVRKVALIPFAALAVAVLPSCVENFDEVREGLPTSLTLTISSPEPAVVSTRATDAQETVVKSLSLFFYNKKVLTQPRVVITLDEADLAECSQTTPTNYVYTVNLEHEDLTSGEYYLYAIANAGSSSFGLVNLESLKTASLETLKATVVEKNNLIVDDMVESSLLLTGVFGRGDGSITLSAGNNDFTKDSDRIHLRRIVSKVSFTIEAATDVTFTPSTYSIHNYSSSCTLFERSGWTGRDGGTDVVSGTFPPADGFSVSEGNKKFVDIEDKDISGTQVSGSTKKSFSFYMMENAAPTVSRISEYRQRDLHVSAADQSFAYAPSNSTYIVISGHYRGPAYTSYDGSGTKVEGKFIEGDVSYTIHLGNFSSTGDSTEGSLGNFAVRRNAKYNYRVSVKGVSSIVVESQYRGDQYQSHDSGAEGNLLIVSSNTTNITLDSHFETVMVKIPKPASYSDYSLRSVTPFEIGGGYTYNSNSSAQANEFPKDVNWIHFAKPASSTALASFPGISGTTTIAGLLEDLSKRTATYYLADEDYYYTTAFVDEYFYYADDGKSPLKPLSRWVNAPERELTLAASIDESLDGKSSFAVTPIFTIRQRSILSMYDIDNVKTPFGIEVLEEFPEPVYLSARGAYLEYGSTSTSDANGWSNFSKNFSDGTARWADYIDASAYGHFDNSDTVRQTSMKRNYAYSQCLSRNRDEDGDGIIDAEEMKWYLPAVQQCQTIWFGYPVLGADARLDESLQAYWTSSYSPKRVWYFDEGSSYGYIEETSSWLEDKLGVRCARTLSAYNATPSDCVSWDADTRTVELTGLVSGATRASGSVTDEYISHQRGDAADILPQAFQVARRNLEAQVSETETKSTFNYKELTTGSWCNQYYYENADQSDKGQWRIPNEREFALLIRYCSAEFNDGKTEGEQIEYPASRTYYYRKYDSTPVKAVYFYDPDAGVVNTSAQNGYIEGSAKATAVLRCVRDVAPATPTDASAAAGAAGDYASGAPLF